MKKYPIGIQDFRKLREENYLYIDKTKVLHHLITSGGYYFLSRPRRFGKSLLISTLKEIFLGSLELFKGLWIENKIDWAPRPVIYLSFGGINSKSGVFEGNFITAWKQIAADHGITLEHTDLAFLVEELLKKLSQKGKVAILIDEYDKPILDHIEDSVLSNENRLILKSFYDVLKNCDQYIHFLFLTGISKFAKVSVFSGLNNLNDITLDASYGDICGYNQEELESYFKEEIESIAAKEGKSIADLNTEIRAWYNGYSWLGKKVYNPFSILNFMSKGTFNNFWFATGHPSFLIKTLVAVNVYKLKDIEVNPLIFDGASVDNIDYRSLLFQTGYLTITSENRERQTLTLNFPNNEVKNALHQYMLGGYGHRSHGDSIVSALDIKDALQEGDTERFKTAVNALYASIPYDIFLKNYEAYYQSVLYIALQLLGIFVKCEVTTSHGRIDTVIHFPHRIYVIEFKIDDSAEAALAQIQEKQYAAPWQASGVPVSLIGIGMSREQKGITSMIVVGL